MAVPAPRSGSTASAHLRIKLLRLWTNAWNTPLFPDRFSSTMPVWILGAVFGDPKAFDYEHNPVPDVERERFGMCRPLTELQHDLRAKIYMSYRQDFPELPESDLSSDVGWGCMLRTGQMLIAQTMVVHLLSRDWRPDWAVASETHRHILRLFGDAESPDSPFSIHNILRRLRAMGVRPGEWLGPSAVGRVLCEAINNEHAALGGPRLRAILARDCVLTMSEMMDGSSWTPLVILVPLRLGLRELSACYETPLKALFTLPQCMGIMGGRPRHALYFIGFQDNTLVAMDPHLCRRTVNVADPAFPIESFHSHTVRRVSTRDIDPSMCLGFYCRTYSDLLVLTAHLANKDIHKGTPLVSIVD
eukprot:m.21355 g.21355  ORF g.21355 m.21355 type:complete len:360 (-) comp8065_c0_seq1:24-1103(-)